MRLIQLPYKCQIKKIFLINLIALMILVLLSVVVNISDNTTQEHIKIDDSELFVYDEVEGLPEAEFTKIYKLNSEFTKQVQKSVTSLNANLYQMPIYEKASNNLKKNYFEYSAGDFPISIVSDFTSEEVKNNIMPNKTYDINEIIEGTYPVADDDVLIGEYVASAYMDSYKLSDYSELVGKEIQVETDDMTQKLTISGIYSGGENLIVSNKNVEFENLSPIEDEVSLYKKFDSKKEKEKFIKNNLTEEQYIDSSSNIVDIFKYIVLAIVLLCNIVYITLNYGILRKYNIVLKHHNVKNRHLMYVGIILNLFIINLGVIYIVLS